MDDLSKQLKNSKYKTTAEYNPDGTLSKVNREFLGKKTRWDWLQLLIIPVLLVLITAGLGVLQFFLSNNIAQQQHDSDQHIAQQQRISDQRIAHDQQEQATLKTYLDDMSNLLLSTGIATPQLLQANQTDEITKVAQAKTQIALNNLDGPEYKAYVINFLYQAGLVNWHNLSPTKILNSGAFPLIRLDYDKLGGIDLRGVYMANVDMRDTFLNNAQMSGSVLSYSNLSISIMQKADLSRSSLHGVDLSGSDLTGATLNDTLLNCNAIAVNPNVVVMEVTKLWACPNLSGVNFTGATMKGIHLQGTDLSGVNLTNADLSGALLSCSNPQNGSFCVNLNGAILNGVNLSGANLQGATVDVAVLEKEAKSLHGTIMPDGTKHA